ncbi:hypothetical protein A0H81_13371 [Grifola frondosa]|uniref:Uncharacterized protein n=1 Tax=Grifola frondosa TaxID=5627 RepID=A0A1C7LP81_GRIFR|nr:hypothetical protein A0H81_13371 [Grifola frondosa]
MSRRRLALNIPILQCQVALPPVPLFWAGSPVISSTPTSPPVISSEASGSPLTRSLRRFSFSSGMESDRNRPPITPVDQIMQTPLTPPKLPRVPLPMPRTWSSLDFAGFKLKSPLPSPSLRFTPMCMTPSQSSSSVESPRSEPVRVPVSCVPLALRRSSLLSPHDAGGDHFQSSKATLLPPIRPTLVSRFSFSAQSPETTVLHRIPRRFSHGNYSPPSIYNVASPLAVRSFHIPIGVQTPAEQGCLRSILGSPAILAGRAGYFDF